MRVTDPSETESYEHKELGREKQTKVPGRHSGLRS